MADLKINAGGVRIQVDLGEIEKASDEYKAARKQINNALKKGLYEAGERVALPHAKRAVSGLRVQGTSVSSTLIVRSTSSKAIISSNLRPKLRKAFGWLEYGGTNKGVLRPKSGQAINTPWGPRAVVYRGSNDERSGLQRLTQIKPSKPAEIRGKKRVGRAMKKHRGEITEAVRQQVLGVFEGKKYIELK